MSTDHLRNETAADALLSRDEQDEWEAIRNEALGLERECVSTREMIDRWAAERAAVEAAGHAAHVRELAIRKAERAA